MCFNANTFKASIPGSLSTQWKQRTVGYCGLSQCWVVLKESLGMSCAVLIWSLNNIWCSLQTFLARTMNTHILVFIHLNLSPLSPSHCAVNIMLLILRSKNWYEHQHGIVVTLPLMYYVDSFMLWYKIYIFLFWLIKKIIMPWYMAVVHSLIPALLPDSDGFSKWWCGRDGESRHGRRKYNSDNIHWLKQPYWIISFSFCPFPRMQVCCFNSLLSVSLWHPVLPFCTKNSLQLTKNFCPTQYFLFLSFIWTSEPWLLVAQSNFPP